MLSDVLCAPTSQQKCCQTSLVLPRPDRDVSAEFCAEIQPGEGGCRVSSTATGQVKLSGKLKLLSVLNCPQRGSLRAFIYAKYTREVEHECVLPKGRALFLSEWKIFTRVPSLKRTSPLFAARLNRELRSGAVRSSPAVASSKSRVCLASCIICVARRSGFTGGFSCLISVTHSGGPVSSHRCAAAE